MDGLNNVPIHCIGVIHEPHALRGARMNTAFSRIGSRPEGAVHFNPTQRVGRRRQIHKD